MFLRFDFDFFFFESGSLFFVKDMFGVLVFRLSYVYFFRKVNGCLSFFFLSSFLFSNFLVNFFKFYNKAFFFFKLKVRGLGYRVRLLTYYIAKIFIGFSNYIYFHCPNNVLMRVRRRRLLLVSNEIFVLKLIVFKLLSLKILTPYGLRGVFFPRQVLLLKPGKKKF